MKYRGSERFIYVLRKHSSPSSGLGWVLLGAQKEVMACLGKVLPRFGLVMRKGAWPQAQAPVLSHLDGVGATAMRNPAGEGSRRGLAFTVQVRSVVCFFSVVGSTCKTTLLYTASAQPYGIMQYMLF